MKKQNDLNRFSSANDGFVDIAGTSPVTYLKAVAAVLTITFALALPASAQENNEPVVVRPGAPGQPTQKLSSSTTGTLPPSSRKDVEFMQGMIVHHQQAVDMVALMADRTENEELLRLGARISQTQAEEIGFMKRWLTDRGNKVSASMSGMDMKGDHSGHNMMDHSMMPGMLTPKQMEELADSDGAEFDRLFLTGMIQHHIGALIMVKDLYDTPGAGQDGQIFNFATDIDSGQRAEIRIMQKMLEGSQEKNQ